MPENHSNGPKNRPGLFRNSGIYAPEKGRYGCIFIQKRLEFCINIQSPVKTFRGSGHARCNGVGYAVRIMGMSPAGHGLRG